MRYLAGLLVAGGCFSPSPPLHSPCPSGVCPSGLVCSPASMTCEETPVDAPGIPDDAPAEGIPSGCYGSFVTVCPDSPITGNTQLTIATPTTLNTTTAPQCLAYHLPGGASDATYCVVGARTVTVSVPGRWAITGTRPLIVIATHDLAVTGGIDAASHRNGLAGPNADAMACVGGGLPLGDQGGPGGSFATVGGVGGGIDAGATVPAGPATPAPTALRGGCPGAAGSGGNAGPGGKGGGALYLIADTLAISGTINASGASGVGAGLSAGGGGGGSGGMIVLDAKTMTLAAAARVFANGGGGGEGGGGSNGGNDGSDPTSPTAIPTGGNGNAGAGGDGGDGAFGASSAGPGQNSNDSGGGGGGGAGVIRVFPSQSLGGSISPPPS